LNTKIEEKNKEITDLDKNIEKAGKMKTTLGKNKEILN
jgi:hypothetical protein